MRVIFTNPPNFEAIAAVIPAARNKGVIFAYGNIIYNPSGGPVMPATLAHEAVHCRQQGDDVDGWWERYLADTQFRFDQEVEAHREEWRCWMKTGTRNRAERRRAMAMLGARLAGPLYGRMVPFSVARALILEGGEA
jgi:hypothetical protein